MYHILVHCYYTVVGRIGGVEQTGLSKLERGFTKRKTLWKTFKFISFYMSKMALKFLNSCWFYSALPSWSIVVGHWQTVCYFRPSPSYLLEEIASEQVGMFTSHQLLHLLIGLEFYLGCRLYLWVPIVPVGASGMLWKLPQQESGALVYTGTSFFKYFKKRFVQNFIHSMKFPHLK